MYIVTTILDNCIQNQFSFVKMKEAQAAFKGLMRFNSHENLDEQDFEDALDDGYWECKKEGVTICIGEPEDGNHPDSFLAEIRDYIV